MGSRHAGSVNICMMCSVAFEVEQRKTVSFSERLIGSDLCTHTRARVESYLRRPNIAVATPNFE
jgi:hypothetical protein